MQVAITQLVPLFVLNTKHCLVPVSLSQSRQFLCSTCVLKATACDTTATEIGWAAHVMVSTACEGFTTTLALKDVIWWGQPHVWLWQQCYMSRVGPALRCRLTPRQGRAVGVELFTWGTNLLTQLPPPPVPAH